jgi:hypothetical protein
MRRPAKSPAQAVVHAGHPGPILACPICVRNADAAVFATRLRALRSR